MSPSSTAPATASASAPAVAVLLLDAGGVVISANPAAHTLWGVAAGQLAGEAFVRLFEFDIMSDEVDWLETQWAAVLATATDQTTPFVARPHDGATRSVLVRIEHLPELPDRHLVTVQSPPDATRRLPTDHTMVPLLAQHGSLGFFDLNLQTGEAWYAPAWKKMLGYTESELADTHDSWLQLLHPDDTAAAPFVPTRIKTTGPRSIDVEFRLRHRRGHYVWIQCVGVQIIGTNGQLERVFGFHLDITERKETEEASMAGDIRLRLLSGAGPLGAFELNFAEHHSWFSPAWKRLLGQPESGAQDHAALFLAALPRSEAEAGLENWFYNCAPGQPDILEPVQLQKRDGSPVTLLLGACRTYSRKRELTRVAGFLCPLPAGAQSADGGVPPGLVDDAFNTLAEAVIITDPRGRILSANATTSRLLQLPAAQLIGRPLDEVFRLVHRESGRTADSPCELALAAEGGLPLSRQHALAVGPAEPLPVVWSARACFGPDGKARGVVIVFRNPEEMTLTPEELVKANRFEALGLLAGGIAHDFNNILATILGGISLAKDNRDYSALGDAEQACLTAKGLTKQLLTFAKGGVGSRIVAATPELLQDSVKLAAAGTNTVVTVDAPDSTWPVEVERSQMLQVFQNLIVNALQAMPPEPHAPRIQLRAANITAAPEQIAGLATGDYVEVEVRDNGSGIQPEHLEKIFDPFFTTKKHGTGLGLATVLSIVRKHGGQIAVDSTLGTGTVFTVFLPRAGQAVEVQARRAASLRFGTGRVLFMDDDEKICALSANMLQSLDYKFDIAKNGEEAIKLYQRYLNIGRPYDVVIMDLTIIGGMGGEECFRVVHDLDPEVRAIVSSGYDNDDMAKRFLDLGFCGYLTKPYRVTDLGKVIKAVLG